MSVNQKEELRNLMRKYLDRSCTDQERDMLIGLIRKTREPEEMDALWQEAWVETGDQVKYDELSWNDLMKVDAQHNRPKTRTMILRWSAAAAVILGVFFMFQWLTQAEEIRIYETGFGENIEFVLDDGTRINLNANSRLVWHNNWEKEGVRTVDLEGEAYFEVAHIQIGQDKEASPSEGTRLDLPFEVQTTDLTIRVLGTSFNAIQRRGKTEVFLEEGLVELALQSQQEESKTKSDKVSENSDHSPGNTHESSGQATSKVVKMLPGEWVSYSSGADELVQKTILEPDMLTEWKDGTLSYQDTEFRFMLQSLEDIYGKTFSVADTTLLHRRVNFGVPYENWETVQDMMGWMLDVEVVELNDNQVRIEKGKEK